MKHILYRIAVWAILAAGNTALRAQITVTDVSTKGAKGAKGDKGDKDEKQEEKMLSKEVSLETTCTANATVFIENIYRDIHIKTSTDNKVRLVTTGYYTGENKLTNEEWFEKLNIQLKGSGSMIIVKSASINTASAFGGLSSVSGYAYNLSSQKYLTEVKGFGAETIGGTNLAVIDGKGEIKYAKSNIKRDITIYIPTGARVDVESKYADVDISNNIGEIKARITNASLTMENVSKAVIISQYGNVNMGNIEDAQLEMTNGRLRAKDISTLDIDTKYSSIELGVCGNISMRSVNDQYEIDQASDLHGRKDYGNLRLTSLTKKIDLEGSNADVKIRSIEASVTDIKIDNKYADLRLPVTNLKNYSVNFDGQYSSVYAPFEKINTDTSGISKSTLEDVAIVVGETEAPASSNKAKPKKVMAFSQNDAFVPMAATLYGSGGNFGEGRDSKFTATVGDTKGAHTVFQLKCINCTVDFK